MSNLVCDDLILIKKSDALDILEGFYLDLESGSISNSYAKARSKLLNVPNEKVVCAGYDVWVLVAIANVMRAKRITAAEAIDILSNAQLLANEIYAEIERTQRKALEEMFNNSICEERGSVDGRTD